ncbi:MAG: ABC-F family ATP-binding cassette domain-containing protein [Verrucomicrobia bacterium]|jgi:ATP-binding cassette subfamily F protein 3|nr:ABC-F family ATP-binding cassette domain-containing protein [Verrucomicrobiota bacterium]
MVTLSEVGKAYAGKTLFSGATLQLLRGDRVGLVGPNGAGKSTLFSLLLGREEPDEGQVFIERNVRVGHLPQESAPVGEETVLELATSVSEEYVALRKQVLALEAGDHDAVNWEDDVHTRFNDLGGFTLEARAKQILKGLGFRDGDFGRRAAELSGGWVMRAHLARLLVWEPELLLLDEPTNHLDLETVLWFQHYLSGYPGAILVISHDREFLNTVVGGIVEIRLGRVFRYRGNYDAFLEQREANEAQILAAYKNQQREIARLMEFVNRFRAKNTKATQAQAKLRQIERMEKIEAPSGPEATVDFSFPQPQRSGLKVITLEDIHHAYGPNVVYAGVDFEAQRGQRIVLVGPNGAGKSTLLKLLAGVLPVQHGERQEGHNVKLGYFSQYRVDTLHPELTVLEEALDTPQRVTETFVRSVLGCFLFRGDDVFKKVAVLSGGEKSRLALVRLLLDPPNLLLMDEPTTHLDLSSVEALLGALQDFSGTIVFISHDVYFIKELANHVVHVNRGQLVHYPGGYDYYLHKTQATSARAALTADGESDPALAAASAPDPSRPSVDRKERKRLEAEERNARARVRREQQAQVNGLETRIAVLEARQAEIAAELEKPETYQPGGSAAQLNREMRLNETELEALTAEWEAAATKLEELE